MIVKNTKEEFVKDIERLFQSAMNKGQLSVALKAKELLGKIEGLILFSAQRTSSPLTQWREDEILSLLNQLESDMAKELESE